MSVEIVREDDVLKTKGLARHRQPELMLRIPGEESVREGEALLRFVADSVTGAGRSVRSSETMSYGYWLIKFVGDESGFLDIWEYDAAAAEFRAGAGLALEYWRAQHDVCARANAKFLPRGPINWWWFRKACSRGTRSRR